MVFVENREIQKGNEATKETGLLCPCGSSKTSSNLHAHIPTHKMIKRYHKNVFKIQHQWKEICVPEFYSERYQLSFTAKLNKQAADKNQKSKKRKHKPYSRRLNKLKFVCVYKLPKNSPIHIKMKKSPLKINLKMIIIILRV